jgi:hypothetical protein
VFSLRSKAKLYAILAIGTINLVSQTVALAQKPPIARLSRRSQNLPEAKAEAKTQSKKLAQPALVPPPPPLVPFGGQMPYVVGAPIAFQSEAELKKTLADLQTQLTSAIQALDKKLQGNNEKQERAKLFDELYKEGVVSRHELEGAQKDAEESQADFKIVQAQKESIQTDFDLATKELSKFVKSKESKSKSLGETSKSNKLSVSGKNKNEIKK